MRLAATSISTSFNELERASVPSLANQPLAQLVSNSLGYIFSIAGFLLLIYLIYAGYMYLMSQGDPKAIEQSRVNITYGIIGFLTLFGAFWIVQIVARILNLQPIIDIFG